MCSWLDRSSFDFWLCAKLKEVFVRDGNQRQRLILMKHRGAGCLLVARLVLESSFIKRSL